MPGLLDLKNGLVWGNTLPPKARTATENGTGVDLQKADGSCYAVVSTGVVTDGTYDVKMQESDDDATYVDISGATFVQIVSTDDNIAPRLIEFKRTKRYVRGVVTIASAVTGALVQVAVTSFKKISG